MQLTDPFLPWISVGREEYSGLAEFEAIEILRD